MIERSSKKSSALPAPIVVDCRDGDLDRLLAREWLISNRIGAYASSTVVGCNARRYHGLLVAATTPPVGRIVTLSTVMERITLGGRTHDLATNEFADAFSPGGWANLVEFRNDVAPTFVFRVGGVTIAKEVMLADAKNASAIRYTVSGAPSTLAVRPFVAMRDFHSVRKADAPHQLTFAIETGGIVVHDRHQPSPMLYLVSQEARFESDPQWWYSFRYRIDAARGQDESEDLYSPGWFVYELRDGESCQFTASLADPLPLGFSTSVHRRRERLEKLARSPGEGADETSRRLGAATDAFVVRRDFPNANPSATILAGFPWFADWGRDAFIALPGLLLTTGRFDQAREVFATFAAVMSDGMVPNRFDDYAASAHYNSIDASLWFILAAERYVEATADTRFWRTTLMPAVQSILKAFQDGTQFGIHADADGLLTGGGASTQLTWMDTKAGGQVVTPRHGKAVEVNALWHSAHRIAAGRCANIDADFARRCAKAADMIARALNEAFWNERLGCLHDCVQDERGDESIRPNQIFAVSLPYSPLATDRQRRVVEVVREHLLTPYGLRSLSPDDASYCSRYAGPWEARDRAYHQGTVWAWLIGPFIEAHLKVEGRTPRALEQARRWLAPFDAHLSEAGLGQVSEIFDADRPHTPRGCIAQAWSVAEVLRAKIMLAE